MVSERDALSQRLRAAGVGGADDFGRFVNTDYFRPSAFDDAAAMPVLLAQLSALTDGAVVAAVARHLRHVSIAEHDFDVLLDAFQRWATEDLDAGWALGDVLAHAAHAENAATMCDLVQERSYGRSRQMIVYDLWRWCSFPTVEPTLRSLIRDPDVSLQAMSALARVVGSSEMISLLEPLTDDEDETIRRHAKKQLAKQRRKAAK